MSQNNYYRISEIRIADGFLLRQAEITSCNELDYDKLRRMAEALRGDSKNACIGIARVNEKGLLSETLAAVNPKENIPNGV